MPVALIHSILPTGDYRSTIDTDAGLRAAEFLMELLKYSPPDILSMSWYERIRPYAAGKIAMAYGYTLLAPYFELDDASPAKDQTGYLPHPAGPDAHPIAPVGGYVMGIPANLPPERIASGGRGAARLHLARGSKALRAERQPDQPALFGGADPDVRQLSPIFEAVDGMSWRDELQFWPRPPIPEISEIIQICGEEFHDMLRGIIIARETPCAAPRPAPMQPLNHQNNHDVRRRDPWTPTV